MPEDLRNVHVDSESSENVIVLVSDIGNDDKAEIPNEVGCCKNNHEDTQTDLPLVTLEDEESQKHKGENHNELN